MNKNLEILLLQQIQFKTIECNIFLYPNTRAYRPESMPKRKYPIYIDKTRSFGFFLPKLLRCVS